MKKVCFFSAAIFASFLSCLAQPFTPDPSFGIGGKTYTNLVDINKSDENSTAVAIQPDGKIIVAGTTIAPAAIARYNTDGSLDNSFDHDGMAFYFGYTFNAMAVQSDGKIVLAGGRNNDFVVIRLNPDGSPDNSFDNDGKLTTSFGVGADIASCLALQSDGKIVVAGLSHNGTDNDFAVARYNSNGSPDNSFDADGKLTLAIGSSNEILKCMAIQNDGKIIVAGGSDNGTAYDFALARFNTDGSPDNSFDGDGKLTTDISSPAETIRSIAIESSGKIIAAGLSGSSINNQALVLCHYNSDGSLDNSFDGDGKLVIANTTVYQIYSVAIQNDGKIFIGGTDNSWDFTLARFNTDGSPDNSFDGDGKQTTSFGAGIEWVTLIAVKSDGQIIAAGRAESTNGTWEDMALARYNSNGSPDNSFHGDGKTRVNIYSSDDHATCMAVQSDGKIVVAGFSYTTITGSTTAGRQFTLSRYNTDGTLDNSFDGDGRVMTAFGVSENFINAIAIQSDGKIVVAGYNLAQDYDFALIRYNSDGSLDNTFDGDGKATTSFSTRQDGASALVIQADGKILVGGFSRDDNNTNNNFAVARFNSNGSLDNSFDGDGKFYLAIGPGTATDQITSMAVQNDGKILLAGYSHNGNDYDFALVRLNSNGSLDNSFDGDGLVTTDLGGSLNNFASAIAVQIDGKIVLAGYRQNETINDFALARYNTNGSLDNTFDGDGIVITSSAGGSGVTTSIVIQNNGRILVGGYSNNGSNNDFALARYNANGSPDNTFDGDGKATFDLETGSSEAAYAMQLRENRIYLAGDIIAAGRTDFALVAVLNDILLSPLPLQLRDFSGKRINNDASLSWKTENETNMLGYTIERSIDGRTYTAAGNVAALNRPNIYNYYFTDANITSLNVPVIYYRLKEKSIDGKYAHSQIIALPLEKNKNIVLFYPNPVINSVNIALTVYRQDKLQIRVIDNKGSVVKQQQWNVTAGSTSLSLDVTNLNNGMYYVEIKGESIDYKKQFVK